MLIGEILETFRSETEVRFEWKMRKIFSLLEIPDKYKIYRSDNIVLLDSPWFLAIKVGNESTNRESIQLDLVSFPPKRPLSDMPVCITIGIKKADGTEEEIVNDRILCKYQRQYCVYKFLPRSDLLNRKSQLAPSDTFTITCSIRSDEPRSVEGDTLASRGKDTKDVPEVSEVPLLHHEDVNVKAISMLQKDLKELLLSGKDRDVTLKVKDQEFRAHKDMLRVRSPVFAAMFKHDMKETADNSISIEDCDPEAFTEFLLYIYTGKVENLTPTNAMGLYYAGDKYDVSGLKEICVSFLKSSLSTTGICDVIVLATKHGEDVLLEHATNYFMRNAKQILVTTEWRRFVRNNPDEANELYIKSFDKCCTEGE